MKVSEIFSELSQHLIKGLMVHSQLMNFFLYLGLEGYALMHKCHYLEENENYIKLCCYYLKHYNTVIEDKRVEDPEIIPKNWFYDSNHHRTEISDYVEFGANTWVEWEQSTKNLLQYCYNELIKMNEGAAALFLSDYIKDVDEELAKAEKMMFELESTKYDMSYVVDDSKEKEKEFCKKKKDK